MPKVSIILPSIESESWTRMFPMIQESCGDVEFEIIAVGPCLPDKSLEQHLNFRYVRDFGCPSRSLMIASELAIGKYICWFPSDCNIFPNTLKDSINLLESKDCVDGMTLLYSEGPGYTGEQHNQNWYWFIVNHGTPPKWTKKSYQIAPIFLYPLDRFRQLGGIDCTFWHINMNTHNLAFRFQENGGKMHFSPARVFAANWHPWTGGEGEIMRITYETNDNPKWLAMWNGEEFPELNWTTNTWKLSNPYWELRYAKQ